MNSIKSFLARWWFLVIYLLVYFIAINAVSINRFKQFDVFYFDHGIFDQALWKAAHFQAPLIDHLDDSLSLQIGDHFNPSFYLLVPLYWLTDSYEAIFILQNLFLVASAVIMFKIAQKNIHNKLMIFALVIAYTLFIGIQNFIISGLHTEFPALFTLAMTLYAISTKNKKMFWIFMLLTLGLKEVYAGIGIGLGIYLFLIKEKKWGLLCALFSILYYLLITKSIIPLISGQAYFYQSRSYDNILKALVQLFYPFQKFETILISFATFGFLPIIALAFLPAVMQEYFIRFVVSNSPKGFDLGLHYNAMVALLLFFASIMGVKYLLKKSKYYRKYINFHALLIIIIVLFFHQFKYHGALGLAYNPVFYKQTQDNAFLETFVKQIPNQGRIMIQNNLAPHLTHTHDIMLLRRIYWNWMPDIIVLDIRSGQNANNYWPTETKKLYPDLIQDPNYTLKEVTHEQVYFVKNPVVDMNHYNLLLDKNIGVTH